MKQVIIIDQTTVFKDYLTKKFRTVNVRVIHGMGELDSLSKMRSELPDLVIIDYNTCRDFLYSLLKGKLQDPNAKNIPIIMLIQSIDVKTTVRLASLGVKHMLPKPIKIDQFFATVKSCMDIDIDIDDTPCILEARINDNIIFVEIAQGLNREKIELLQFKIRELIELYNIAFPKVIVLMTDLSLSFIDGPNIELLLDVIMADSRIKNHNIILLSLDNFVAEFVAGTSLYKGIQVLQDLSEAVDLLVKTTHHGESTDIINDKILCSTNTEKPKTSLEMRFKSELEMLKSREQDYTIAVVDDDVTIRTLVSKTLQTISNQVYVFKDGLSFLKSIQKRAYDLIFLDLMMPGIDGFGVLKTLQEQNITTPVIVLSAISKRELVMQVLSSGVKSYMIKPIKPDAIIKKTIELLNYNL